MLSLAQIGDGLEWLMRFAPIAVAAAWLAGCAASSSNGSVNITSAKTAVATGGRREDFGEFLARLDVASGKTNQPARRPLTDRPPLDKNGDWRYFTYEDYMQEALLRAETSWTAMIKHAYDGQSWTNGIVVECVLRPDGAVTDVYTVSTNTPRLLQFQCEAALLGSSFPPWSAKVKQKIGRDQFPMAATFHYSASGGQVKLEALPSNAVVKRSPAKARESRPRLDAASGTIDTPSPDHPLQAQPQEREEGSRNPLFADYDKKMISQVNVAWDWILDGSFPSSSWTGKIVVRFVLHPDGSVSDINAVSTNAPSAQRFQCEAAILRASPFGSWPIEARKTIGKEWRPITFTFQYQDSETAPTKR